MDQQQYRSACISTAIHLCRLGIRVMPAQFRSKSPLGGASWNKVATNDVNALAGLIPAGVFNIGMVFGPSSGVMDIEPDTPQAAAIIEQLMAENGVKTLAYKSRRGVHRIFKWTDKLSHLGNNPKTTHGLECRIGSEDKSFYSICPPSVHQDTGETYEWLPGCAPWQVVPTELPENVYQYIITNAKTPKSGERVHEVYADGDGYLPGEGGRHDYLLTFSKSLYCDWQLPLEDCMELTRHVSMRIGSYQEPGRGEVELKNLFKDLQRPNDPIKQMQASISIGAVNEVSEILFEKYRETNQGPSPEIPAHVMHPTIEKASRDAYNSQMPRNLWIMSIIAASAAAIGTSTLVRVSSDHQVMANQLYCFGVGGSGTGKSKTLNAINAPFASSDTVLTDSTPEALTSALAKYPRGIMLEFHEGKDFYKMLGRYNQNGAQSDNSLYHRAWSGDRTRMQRQKGACWIERPHLVVSAAIQRLNLNQLPQNDLVDGLGQRMMVYPIGAVPKKASREALARHAEFIHIWHEVLGRLQGVKVTVGSVPLSAMMAGTGTVTKPLVNTLSEEARAIWEEYAAYKRSDQVEGHWPDPEHPFRSDIVRHAEIALRLANVLFMIDHAMDRDTWYEWKVAEQDFGTIPKGVMQRAIDLMEWLWVHKQIYFEPLVEAAFAAVTGGHMLQKAEAVPAKVDKYVEERKRRVERHMKDESFTLRDYYRLLSLKKVDAQKEIDMFLREGHVVDLGIPDGGKSVRYKFLEMRQ